ncbi:dUTP diphosphatase [bacterium]|nr:dUTP diphosphatase [bacterium]
MIPTLRVKRLVDSAVVPSMAHPGEDAGLDLYSPVDLVLPGMKDGVAGSVKVPLGIAVDFPKAQISLDSIDEIKIPQVINFHGEIGSRSGLGMKGVLAFPGVIDNGYKGEIVVKLFNLGPDDITIKNGDRVAQMLVRPWPIYNVVEVDQLEQSQRGSGGFGSSGN